MPDTLVTLYRVADGVVQSAVFAQHDSGGGHRYYTRSYDGLRDLITRNRVGKLAHGWHEDKAAAVAAAIEHAQQFIEVCEQRLVEAHARLMELQGLSSADSPVVVPD